MRAPIFFCLLVLSSLLHAQDDCLFTADITTSTALWGAEVSWTLYTTDGDPVVSGDGFESNAVSTTSACLEDSFYVLEMIDVFGDGWNGAEVTIAFAALGIELGSYTLEQGDYETLFVGIGTGFDNENPVVVRVRDGMGRLVRSREVIPGQGPQGWMFDVRDWSAGIYTVEGTQGTRRARARFIVAR